MVNLIKIFYNKIRGKQKYAKVDMTYRSENEDILDKIRNKNF